MSEYSQNGKPQCQSDTLTRVDCCRSLAAGFSLRSSLSRSVSSSLKRQNTEAVVLYHGITGTPAEMEDLARFLYDRGFDVFVPCLSGHRTSIEELKRVKAKVWVDETSDVFSAVDACGYENVFLVGLSFGALLSLSVACHYPKRVAGIVLLSVPMQLNSWKRELLLRILSVFPDIFLNRLGVIKKKERKTGVFVKPRDAYPVHSLAAAARVIKIRRSVRKRLRYLTCPLLVMQDPNDHHIAAKVPELISRYASNTNVEVRWCPEGQHELTLGKHCMEVFQLVGIFLDRAKMRQQVSSEGGTRNA